MAEVYDNEGHALGDIPVTEQQLILLEAGENVTVQFHTPQMLRNVLGTQNGSFVLGKVGDQIVASNANAAKRCAAIQAAIKKMRGE